MPVKVSITEKIGEELVDNTIEAGLALLLVVGGFSYFNLSNKWMEALGLVAEKVGLSGSEAEVSLIVKTISNTFPFNFIQSHTTWAVAIGILLCIIGIVIKIITLKSKEEFIKDLGEIILVPGIIGIISVVFIQIMTVNSLNELLMKAQLVSTQLAFSKTTSGIMLWNMMGILFLTGFFSLVFGAMLYYVSKSLGNKPLPLYILGKFLVFIGWFSLIYYAVLRVFSLDIIAQSLYGENIIKLFAFSWYMARSTFIVALVMFALGFSLYTYGRKEIKKKRIMELKEAKRMSYMQGVQPHQYTQPGQHQHHNPEHYRYK